MTRYASSDFTEISKVRLAQLEAVERAATAVLKRSYLVGREHRAAAHKAALDALALALETKEETP